MASQVGDGLVTAILDGDQSGEAGIAEQRKRVEALRRQLAGLKTVEARRLETLADYADKHKIPLGQVIRQAYDKGLEIQ